MHDRFFLLWLTCTLILCLRRGQRSLFFSFDVSVSTSTKSKAQENRLQKLTRWSSELDVGAVSAHYREVVIKHLLETHFIEAIERLSNIPALEECHWLDKASLGFAESVGSGANHDAMPSKRKVQIVEKR